MNTIDKGWIDYEIEELIKFNQRQSNSNQDKFIQLCDEFSNFFDSNLYKIGPSRFLTMFKKINNLKLRGLNKNKFNLNLLNFYLKKLYYIFSDLIF